LATSTANLNWLYNCVSHGLFSLWIQNLYLYPENGSTRKKKFALRASGPKKQEKCAYQHLIKENFSKNFFQIFAINHA